MTNANKIYSAFFLGQASHITVQKN